MKLGLAVLATLIAHGVDDPPAGIEPLYDGDHLVGALTNYGLLLADEGGVMRWTPEEPLDVPTLTGARVQSGRVVLGTTGGTFETSDGGCSWRDVDPDHRAVTAVLEIDGTVLIATEGGRGEQGVYAYDGSLVPRFVADRRQARALAASGGTVYASVFDPGAGAYVVRSNDAGATFTSSIALPSAAHAMFADDEGLLLLFGTSATTTTIAAVVGDRLSTIAQVDVRLESIARDGGRIVVVDENRNAFVVGATLEPFGPARSFVYCGAAVCRALDVTQGETHFVDLATEAGLISFRDVAPRTCPPGSVGESAVTTYWPTLQALGVGPAETPDAPNDEGGCDCTSMNAGFDTGLWLLLMVRRPRRGRRCR